ncbi:hypothetical protein T4D_12538 [Trichinella pseudospiralis]|uniref:Uncharacterized protein n=1 Tax=Trichinella pseudospiralis TaxID=6337 RepID=A0A0V1FX58_TRIPS|nr:hypothetical protein T4D_12538 [Trichinella pseudospiralis]
MPFLAAVSQGSGLHLFQDEGNFPIASICIKVRVLENSKMAPSYNVMMMQNCKIISVGKQHSSVLHNEKQYLVRDI